MNELLGKIKLETVSAAFTEDEYATVGYLLILASGVHILVLLKFAPGAGVSLQKILGSGTPGVYIAALEALGLLFAFYLFWSGYKLYDNRILAFSYGLFNINTGIPYLNVMYSVLSSVKKTVAGFSVSFQGLAAAALYIGVSLLIVGVFSKARFVVVEIFKIKSTGAAVRLKPRPGSTIKLDEGDSLRILVYSRRDQGVPQLYLDHPTMWIVQQHSTPGRLEAVIKQKEPIEDVLIVKVGGAEIFRAQLKPAVVIPIRRPDTKIEFELIIPTEGGKVVRKVLMERPGGEKLSKVLEEEIPEGYQVLRILKIEGGEYIPIRNPDEEITKPKTKNKYVIELTPAQLPAKLRAAAVEVGAKPKPKAPSPTATPAPPSAHATPAVSVTPVTAPSTPIRASRELVDKVKKLIEEYSELREDLW
ncbi:MAG: hypothetical protein F7C35_06105 [Desulfurococcales archaeon]|nr:hypothetical protein [Desulfurococcales archaeon]